MIRYFLPAVLLFLTACNNAEQATDSNITPATVKKVSFFPVTAYFKGQLIDIRQKGQNPMKFVTVNNHTDSVIIKFEELDSLVKEFLTPVIDTSNLIAGYTETKFLDQTINAFTYTYDINPGTDPEPMLRHWDVYVDPENGKVKRVYIIKKTADNKTLQLTWQHNQWFKTTVLAPGKDGNDTIEREEKIVWDY